MDENSPVEETKAINNTKHTRQGMRKRRAGLFGISLADLPSYAHVESSGISTSTNSQSQQSVNTSSTTFHQNNILRDVKRPKTVENNTTLGVLKKKETPISLSSCWLQSFFMPVSTDTLQSEAFRLVVSNSQQDYVSEISSIATWIQGPRGHGKTKWLRNIYDNRSAQIMCMPTTNKNAQKRFTKTDIVIWNFFKQSCGGVTAPSSSDAIVDQLFQTHDISAKGIENDKNSRGVFVIEYLDDCFSIAKSMDDLDSKQDRKSSVDSIKPLKKGRCDVNQQNLAMGIIRFISHCVNRNVFKIFITTEKYDNWWLRLVHRTLFPRSSSSTELKSSISSLEWPFHFNCPQLVIERPMKWNQNMVVFSSICIGDIINAIARLVNHLSFDNIHALCANEGFSRDEIQILESVSNDDTFYQPILETSISTDFLSRARKIWTPVEERLSTWCTSSLTSAPFVRDAWMKNLRKAGFAQKNRHGSDECDHQKASTFDIRLKDLLVTFMQHRINHLLGFCSCDLMSILINVLYRVYHISEDADENETSDKNITETQLKSWMSTATTFDQWVQRCDFGLMATYDRSILIMPSICKEIPPSSDSHGERRTSRVVSVRTSLNLAQKIPPAFLLSLCLHPKTYRLTFEFHQNIFLNCIDRFGIPALLQQFARNICRKPLPIGSDIYDIFPIGSFTPTLNNHLVVDNQIFYASRINTLLSMLGFGISYSPKRRNQPYTDMLNLMIRINIYERPSKFKLPTSEVSSMDQRSERVGFNIYAMHSTSPVWHSFVTSISTHIYHLSSILSPTISSKYPTSSLIEWRNDVNDKKYK